MGIVSTGLYVQLLLMSSYYLRGGLARLLDQPPPGLLSLALLGANPLLMLLGLGLAVGFLPQAVQMAQSYHSAALGVALLAIATVAYKMHLARGLEEVVPESLRERLLETPVVLTFSGLLQLAAVLLLALAPSFRPVSPACESTNNTYASFLFLYYIFGSLLAPLMVLVLLQEEGLGQLELTSPLL
jgi:hypothetical protein